MAPADEGKIPRSKKRIEGGSQRISWSRDIYRARIVETAGPALTGFVVAYAGDAVLVFASERDVTACVFQSS